MGTVDFPTNTPPVGRNRRGCSMQVRLGPVRPVIWIPGDICKRCPLPPPKRPNRETEWDRATPPAEPDHSQGHPRGRGNLPWPISDSRRHTRASAAQLTCPVGLPGRLFSAVPIAAGCGTRTARLRPRHTPRQRLLRGGGARQRSGAKGSSSADDAGRRALRARRAPRCPSPAASFPATA